MAKFEKKEVKLTQVGRNLTVMIGGEKFTTTGDKETLTPIKETVKAYEAKPTEKLFKMMMEALKPQTTAVEKTKEELKGKVKGAKKKVEEVKAIAKKEGKTKIKVADVVKDINDKEFSTEELDKMEAAIKAQREKKAPVAQQTSKKPSGREW